MKRFKIFLLILLFSLCLIGYSINALCEDDEEVNSDDSHWNKTITLGNDHYTIYLSSFDEDHQPNFGKTKYEVEISCNRTLDLLLLDNENKNFYGKELTFSCEDLGTKLNSTYISYSVTIEREEDDGYLNTDYWIVVDNTNTNNGGESYKGEALVAFSIKGSFEEFDEGGGEVTNGYILFIIIGIIGLIGVCTVVIVLIHKKKKRKEKESPLKEVIQNKIEKKQAKKIEAEQKEDLNQAKKKEEQRITAPSVGSQEILPRAEVDYKKRLFGMIRVEKQIDLDKASQSLKISKDDLKSIIYDLAGEGKVQGSFQGSVFQIGSDVDSFIKVLDDSFGKWEENLSKKE